tara:strand:- start:748 stop:3516 length:2769 start_codon:yes stop_codon:yes gene_type:complete
MRNRALSLPLGLIFACWIVPAQAGDFFVGDSTTQITVGDFPGLAAGDTINFQGNIQVGPPPVAVLLTGVPAGLNLNFQSGSVTNGVGPFGIGLRFDGDLDGSLLNDGVVSGRRTGIRITGATSGSFINNGTIFNSPPGGGPSGAIRFVESLTSTGSFLNTGRITGNDSHAIIFAPGANLAGRFENRGLIQGIGPGPAIGVFARGLTASGVFINSGTISGMSDGVHFNSDIDGVFINHSTITGGVLGEGGVHVVGDLNGSFLNYGTIAGFEDGVHFDGDLNGSFVNYGTITAVEDDGVVFDDDLNGSFMNYGTIIAEDDAVDIDDDLAGLFINYGFLQGVGDTGIQIYDDLEPGSRLFNYGTIRGMYEGIYIDDDIKADSGIYNYGTILGDFDGIDIEGDFEGLIFNCGVIEGTQENGIEIDFSSGGTIRNHGGRIQGGMNSIFMGDGMGATVVLSGPSHLVGAISGSTGASDVLRFENMRGISAAKQAELAELAAADPTTGSVTLFGEVVEWRDVEDIQADGASLVSYQSLLDSGLRGYASSLDNVLGLNDSFREYLKVLNDIDASRLNAIASNASGRNFRDAMSDLAREQDTNFFHLFSNQFSSLRGDVSGSLASNQSAGVQSSGLFSQEVQVGMAVAEPSDEVNTWVTSYVGSGKQDANRSRAAADYDNTSILFGRGSDINENWYLGAFGGYSRNEGQVDGFGSYLENNGGWVGANAQFQSGDVFANFAGALGFQDVKSIRRDFLANQMQGDTESFGGFLYSQMGRDFFVGEERNTRVSPYAGLTLSSQKVDAFTEQGPVLASLRFDDDTTTTFQTVLGVNVTGHCDTTNGWIRPRADLAWWHNFDDGQSSGAGLAAPGMLNGFVVTSNGANQNRGVFQVGVEFGCDKFESWVFEAGYFGVMGESNYNSHGGTFGARVEF